MNSVARQCQFVALPYRFSLTKLISNLAKPFCPRTIASPAKFNLSFFDTQDRKKCTYNRNSIQDGQKTSEMLSLLQEQGQFAA